MHIKEEIGTVPFVFHHFIMKNVSDLGGLSWIFSLLNTLVKNSWKHSSQAVVSTTFQVTVL